MNAPVNLDNVIETLDHLPEVPTVALEVSRLLDNSNCDAKHLANAIMPSPSLVAQVLKLCNSAHYGLNRKIATISEAVAILGQKALKQIVYTIISHGVLNRPIQGYALESGALWQNALTCAIYARHLAKKVPFRDPELAFTAGLLRDMGKIAMDTYIKDVRTDIERIVYAQKCSFLEAEEQAIGFNHCSLGAKLASRWNLPEPLVNVIEFHHSPSQMPDAITPENRKLVALIHLADSYTMMTGTGVGTDGLMYPLDSIVFNILEIDVSDNLLEKWFSELLDLQQEVQAICKSFGVN